MSAHRGVIEVGPADVRRLCCGASTPGGDDALVAAALDAVDDPVALVGGHPVGIDALWSDVLRSIHCGQRRSVIVVHPSWWPASRVAKVVAAASDCAGEVLSRPRSWLLAGAETASPARVVVEIAPRLVAVTAARTTAEPRTGTAARVAEAVAGRVAEVVADTGTVLIDGPATVGGAVALAARIAERIEAARPGLAVRVIDDTRSAGLVAAAGGAVGAVDSPAREPVAPVRRPRLRVVAAAAGVAAALAVPGLAGHHRHRPAEVVATVVLVEGRITVQVPAHWPVQRITDGPGSARVQVNSPWDPQVALHLTQSPLPAETLDAAAESLKRAIDAEPAGVFVDFNPVGHSAGRAAITYTEVRPGHDIRWTVLLDGAVRIAIGCQSRPDAVEAVRAACEQAVGSAHVLG